MRSRVPGLKFHAGERMFGSETDYTISKHVLYYTIRCNAIDTLHYFTMLYYDDKVQCGLVLSQLQTHPTVPNRSHQELLRKGIRVS